MEASATVGPSYELGSVNVDSLKEILNQLGGVFPFQNEVDKIGFHEQVASIDSAGDPHADNTEVELSDAEKRIAELEAQLAAAQADASGSGN